MKNYPQELLWREARRMLAETGQAEMILRSPKNTSRLERKWRTLNKFRASLLPLPPARFDLHVLRIMDAHNTRSVRRRISAAVPAQPEPAA